VSVSRCAALAATAAAGVVALAPGTAASGAAPAAPVFSHPTRIDNPYMPVSAYRRCALRGRADGTRERSVRTLLRHTRRFSIAGSPVDAAIVRDDSYEDGRLVESTRDYFAQDDAGTVYYLGERVHAIRRGRVVGHGGSWLLGPDTEVPGVIMPAHPATGDQFRPEDVPGVTTESDRVEETGLRALVHGVLYRDVIRVSEFVQPEGDVEYKLYAPGVGAIVEYEPEGRATLVRCVR
jgi:hypothetical protein